MRHLILIPAAFALLACEPTGTATSSTPIEHPPGCNPAGYQALVGESPSKLRLVKLDRPYRVVRPNDVVTLEYNPNRLNFIVNREGKISKASCG